MSEVVISKRDVLAYERLRIISELAPIRERVKAFEKKYGMTLKEFERKLTDSTDSEESFEAWDDYIEWKAYVRKLEELEKMLKEIEHAQRVRIA